MPLFRDLWSTAPLRTAVVAVLVLVNAVGMALAAALAGPVLVDHSMTAFVALAIALTAAVFSDTATGLLMARVSADWTADVRRRLCRVALGQDIPKLESTPVGELLDRIDNDVYQIGGDLRGSGIRVVQSVAIGLVSVVTALVVWWPAGVGMVVLATILVLWLAKPTQSIAPARMAEEEAWSDLAAVMEESIHGQDDVRTSLARPYVLRLFAARSREVLRLGRVVWRLSAKVTTMAVGVMRVGVAIAVVGGVWALTTGRIDGSRLTAIWLLVIGFAGVVEHMSRMVPELQNALGAWGRVLLLKGSAQEPVGGAPPPDADISVRGLTFRYPAAEASGRPAALRDVDLSFVRGRSYAVVGRTGSGKSTLAKVLTRSVDVPRGTVRLGDTDLVDIDLEGLRRWVAIVPQRTEILAGTLAENVALFDPELIGRAGTALAELGLSTWVAELPDGLETRLGEGGNVLSAGQEQLVAFARILVRDPHVVILDEATARLDPVTEGRVQQATQRLLRDRIGIVIAHRLSSVRRCDEVIVLADGAVLEAGPLRESERFAALMARSRGVSIGGVALADRPDEHDLVLGDETGPADVAPHQTSVRAAQTVPPKADPPPVAEPKRPGTLREILRLMTNDPRYGIAGLVIFCGMTLLGLDGSVLPYLWASLVDGSGGVFWPTVGIIAGLLVYLPMPYVSSVWYPEWWVRQMLRISLRLLHGQTGPRRVSKHTPAEVVAQAGDTERVVLMADHLVDQTICVFLLVSMTLVSQSLVPAGFFLATVLISGLVATAFGGRLERLARSTVAARAAFATALVSSLSAARTVKLAGASEPVLAHLAHLDFVRSDKQRREISTQVLARSTPSMVSGLLPIGAWALYLGGGLSGGAALVTVATLGAARWFAWTTASLVAQLPSARVWTRRTAAMAGQPDYSAEVPGVDISLGIAPAPVAAPRTPLRELELRGFSAVHEDGTIGVRDVDLTLRRGQLVLVVGPVGAGKSSLLRAMAGIVHHGGLLRWNEEAVTEPELFLRPNQVGYVGQLPRVLSGTVADNIELGHQVDAEKAVTIAQLSHDLAAAGGGLGLLIGHKGTRLSGGQLQRLALARALAPRTELLIADDVSSALDVTTELDLWRALRSTGVTVIGSTSKQAALAQADHVVVLTDGTVAASGPWQDLAPRWGHLAG
ncbi:ABC-type multidrug transport system, ATPase and permease component [Asanoa hainanensis]|uniref:ABC-type multidrug transport system, ATPase and permease component n=1 Tax=Asanoa hainanensis TaxID=560556 RepID=A0A239K1C8_9ACTN|nr:ABC transporter ATP-binding protein [Asanoa hainanensis]SNT11830.1 ABC-type multidrug transport system, ATPase and permease component [Asanoa hainanensis]